VLSASDEFAEIGDWQSEDREESEASSASEDGDEEEMIPV
jgi:hypothetical protein